MDTAPDTAETIQNPPGFTPDTRPSSRCENMNSVLGIAAWTHSV